MHACACVCVVTVKYSGAAERAGILRRREGPGSSGTHLDVLLIRVLIILDRSNGLLHLAKDHVQMLIICLPTAQQCKKVNK